MKDCLKHEKLNTLVSEGNSDTETPTRVSPLQLLGTLRAIKSNAPPFFLYVELTLNSSIMQEMVDIGATLNFINEVNASRLGLSIGEYTSHVKANNSHAQ